MITGPATKITNLGALKIAMGWKWSKTQYLCGIAAAGAGLLSTFYQH
jgi:hypothetical protein